MRSALACLLAGTMLTACTVGPDYKPPEQATPAGFSELNNAARATPAVPLTGQGDLSTWWTRFNDPVLQQLIAQAMKSNLDLQTAASRIREARQQETIAGSAALPQVSASATGLHFHSNSSLTDKINGGTSSGAAAGASSGSTDLDLYSAGFDATWEIDVFGGVRRGVESASASTEAAVWQMRDSEVSLSAEIANDYLMLRGAQLRLQILKEEIARQRGQLDLSRARAKAGLVSGLDVEAAQVKLSQAESEQPGLESQVRAMEHAIAVLLGAQPEAMAGYFDKAAPVPALPRALPVGLPSDLLRRRPDIRAAERKLASATAEIGVAMSDLYPKFNLIGGASFTGNNIGTLFNTDNFGAFGLGSVMWSIFNGGKVEANIQAKREEAYQALLAYRKTVLTALQETEDTLSRYAAGERAVVLLQQTVSAAQASATLSQQQYQAGLTTYLDVLSAEDSVLTTRDQLAQSEVTNAQNVIALYKALGGGWSPTSP